MHRRRRGIAAGVLAAWLNASPANAQTADDGDLTTFSLRTSIKASALMSRTPDSPFADRTETESMWRLRVEPVVRAGSGAVFAFAYEQRLRHPSAASGFGTLGILPSQSAAPFRIRSLDWSLAQTSAASWRHEIDRASVQWHVRRVELCVGRQAIGWGRGALFGAVDLFAPFSLLEADREWRRGVDAVRADIKVTDRSSLELVGAFDTTWDRSAAGARLRGFAGSIDVEVMAGRRARDLFGGLTTSAAVGDAEVHGELAAFRVRPEVSSGEAQVVWKAVAGGSYRIPIGSGILAYAEYHYSGFGARRPEDILPLLSTAGFVTRYLRGDMQILSRHAVGLTASYEASPEMGASLQWLHNPRDGSGIAGPGIIYTTSDHASVVAMLYVPYGRPPSGLVLRSEFGAASLSALVQVRLYL
jgi:hypothetical protein